jgi:hypothetical protein
MARPQEGDLMETRTKRPAPVAPILMLVGGALAAVGSFLSWANVTVSDVSATAKGTDGSDGYITLVCGVVLVVVGLVSFRGGRRALGVLALLAGLVAGAVGVYDAVTAQDSVLDAVAEQVAPQVGASVSAVRAILQQSADAGDLNIQLQAGLYLVIAGGALGLIGGIVAVATAGRAEMRSAPTMPATSDQPAGAGPSPIMSDDVPPPSSPPPPPPVEPPTS